jgi:hypothetical protein
VPGRSRQPDDLGEQAGEPELVLGRVQRLDDAVRVEVEAIARLQRQAGFLERGLLEHADRQARAGHRGGGRRAAAAPAPGARPSRSGSAPTRASITP